MYVLGSEVALELGKPIGAIEMLADASVGVGNIDAPNLEAKI